MGRPRKFTDPARDKIARNVREAKSAAYTDGYLDGAKEGFAAGNDSGYNRGYDDATNGSPRQPRRNGPKRPDRKS